MSYDIYFEGEFHLDRPFEPAHLAALEAFDEAHYHATLQQPGEVPLPNEGGCDFGFDHVPDQAYYREHGLVGKGRVLAPGEESRDYSHDWIQYLVQQLWAWGYKVTGAIHWDGDNADDFGMYAATGDGLSRHVGVKDYRLEATLLEDGTWAKAPR